MFDMGADKEHIDRGPGLPGSGREDYLGFGRERGSRWFRAGFGRAHGNLTGIRGEVKN